MLAMASALVATTAVVQPSLAPAAETVVASVVEDLRAAEFLMDADSLQRHLAHSFTLVRGGARTSGAFAYTESFRRLRERKAQVRELTFDQRRVAVFGASAVVTYVVTKVWVDEGVRRSMKGWCTDVFELRDDGVWLLVHRHRP